MNGLKGVAFSSFTREEALNIKYIVSDVDDTITYKGKLLPIALKALYDLKDLGKKIILVTGGSAGWSDIYLRQWPVDYVVAESGALLLAPTETGDVSYLSNPTIDEKLVASFKKELLSKTSECTFSSDQYARIYDIAYDKTQNTSECIDDIKHIVESLGGKWAESSIHLNVWFGDYNKRDGVKAFLPYITNDSIDTFISSSIYLGDSFNDQIMFDFFPSSIGMKSVEDRRKEFEILPKYITNGYGGYGFSEVVEKLKSHI